VKDPRQSVKVEQTSRHFCKHITAVRSADSSIRIEARRRRNETFGIMESPIDPETGVSSEAPVEQPTMGRRAAISAQKSKSAADRLAEVESQAAALRAQVKALLHENDPEQGDLDYDRDKRKGKYTFPQRGTHAHGIAIKTQPKWATAEDI
jgi:hypothetical protein